MIRVVRSEGVGLVTIAIVPAFLLPIVSACLTKLPVCKQAKNKLNQLVLSLRNYYDEYMNQAGADHLDILVTLFDVYRVFYDRSSGMILAREFLSDRIANDDSVLFIVIDDHKRRGVKFVQLYS